MVVLGKRHSGTVFFRGVITHPPFCHYSYAYQEEVGENGTPHIQGFIHWKNPVAVSTIKAWNPRIHWEQVRSVVNSVAYCTDPAKRKPGGRCWTLGYRPPSAPKVTCLELDSMYTWQRALAAEIETPPHPRHIIWYYDQRGGSGKTELAKYILTTYPHSLFLSGGAFKDISFQIVKAKVDPGVVIVNLPRTSDGKVSYASLEAAKDGLVQTGKYEGGHRLFPQPHVIVFANFLPDVNALSQDRWQIRYLDNNIIIE